MMADKIPVIDADAHVNPPVSFWQEYLPAKLRPLAPVIEPGGPGDDHDWVVFEGNRKPLSSLSATAGKRAEEYKRAGRIADVRSGNWEPAERLKDMDMDGVETAVMFGGGPLGTANSELYVESFKAYNRWLADFCAYDRSRLHGVAYIPMRDIDESVAMLKEAAKQGMKAVNIPGFPQTPGMPIKAGFAAQTLALTGDPNGKRQYDDPEFDPFWRAAVEHDMAVTIHLGARIAMPGMDGYRFLPNLVMTKFSMAEPIAIMIFGGVFDRFTKLRFGSIESGVGWFAFMAEYMDAIWNNQKHWTKNALKNPPSHYMSQNIYGSFIRDPIGVANRNLLGAGNIMWSTDYPHSETTWPNSMDILEYNFRGVPEEERRPILYDNAKKFYAL